MVDGGPVSTLAPMPVRCGLVLRITDADGAFGWGEAWCNYPPKGNASKLNLLRDPIAATAFATPVADWRDLRPVLKRKLERMIIHTGEAGPFAHCFAALDMAAADLAARRRGVGLATFLGARDTRGVRVYASSPGTANADTLAAELAAAGHTGVKIKIGFDTRQDAEILRRFRAGETSSMQLFVDANQTWTAPEACRAITALAPFDPSFVEEPILATAPMRDWVGLGENCGVPLAAGENIMSAAAFTDFVDRKGLTVIQPDVAKWGGVSGALEVGHHAIAAGAGCFLHYMGTAVGLAASLHTLAAIGGGGRVELDANPNPLRTDLGDIDLTVRDGFLPLPDGPGIGFAPDPDALRRFADGTADLTARS